MDHPWWLLTIIPATVVVWWSIRGSVLPWSAPRRRVALGLRLSLIVVAALALSAPWLSYGQAQRAVVFVMDHSDSQGPGGWTRQRQRVADLAQALPRGTWIAVASAGSEPQVVQRPQIGLNELPSAPPAGIGGTTDLAAALQLASGLFPPDSARQIVVISDGGENRGDARGAARGAHLSGVQVLTVAIAGDARPDVRVARLRSSRARAHEGQAIDLHAELESSLTGTGAIRLFENGIEVERRALNLRSGDNPTVSFHRSPPERNLYAYRVQLEGFTGDTVAANDQASAMVDVAGRPRVLVTAPDANDITALRAALEQEGMRVDLRLPGELPSSPGELAAWDAVLIADVPARAFTDTTMAALHSYVEVLGGGLIVSGGPHSFGVGGYYRTPIEDLLPVLMQAPDSEERLPTALALVIDRSGSMSGDKLEQVKSAAIATVGLLAAKDYIGVVAFDSDATWVVPMDKAADKAGIQNRIARIDVGGGTNIHPGMTAARTALQRTGARIKHMIVLTDGQSSGSGYPELSAACRAERITVSTVAVGGDADAQLLEAMAKAGGGKFYLSTDPTQVTRIFTQDTMTHLGKLVREQPFTPKQTERHPLIDGWPVAQAPQILGYVRTHRRAAAQAPLVTDLGDPLLAHWRFGTGKVTAFTADCGSRWSGLWLSNWPEGYAQLWTQIVRETAREPSGRRSDLSLTVSGGMVVVHADLLSDAATFRNDGNAEADLLFVPIHGGAARPFGRIDLRLTGPGRMDGRFRPNDPGVYLVRLRAGGDLLTAAWVHDPGAEVASGRIDQERLGRIASAGGGGLLTETATISPPPRDQGGMIIELRPWLVALLLMLIGVELVVRRWENVLGVLDRLGLRQATEA